MAMYSTDDELARPGSANGISFGSPGGVLFFGNQTHLSTPSPSPNSTLLMSPAGNSANGKDNVPVAAGDQQILQHLYECFLSGAYSDLLLRFHGEQVSEFHVHKLIVCRSPMIQQMLQTNPMYDLTVPTSDPNITREGLTTCLGSLYSSHSRDLFATTLFSEDPATQSKYLRSVLAAALFLKLSELAQLAVDLIKADINRTSVIDYITFVSHPDFMEYYQPYSKDIKDSIFTYLCKLAVREIANQGLEGAANIWVNKGSEAYKELVRLFAELPFEWLKLVVETKLFEMPSDKDRHDFARQVISLRSQTQSPNRPKIVAGEENVVLAFGGKEGNKSGVTIVRKQRPQAQQQQAGFGVGRQTGLLNGNGVSMMNGTAPHEGRRIWKIGE